MACEEISVRLAEGIIAAEYPEYFDESAHEDHSYHDGPASDLPASCVFCKLYKLGLGGRGQDHARLALADMIVQGWAAMEEADQ